MASKKHLTKAQGTVMTSQEVAATVPVFTKEFIQHNKVREEEVRQLRRTNQQLEKQNQELYVKVCYVVTLL